MNIDRFLPPLDKAVDSFTAQIKHEMERRAYLAANEMRNASQLVLRGTRSGRVYKVPGTHGKRLSKATKAMLPDYGKKLRGGRLYRASAPGEAPANRLGTFRESWQASSHVVYGSYISRIESDVKTEDGKYNLGEILENGTDDGRIQPRPFEEPIMERAKPKILRIYNQPYF